MAVSAKRATEDDLRATPRDGRKYELVDGDIRVSPTGARHEVVSLKLAARLLAYAPLTILHRMNRSGASAESPPSSDIRLAPPHPQARIPESY